MPVEVSEHSRRLFSKSVLGKATVPSPYSRPRGFKSALYYNIGNDTLMANIVVKKVSAKSFDKPIVMRDAEGNDVIYAVVDKVTGNILPQGYGRVLMNSRGERIPKEQIRYFTFDSQNREVEISPYDSNVGGGKQIKVMEEVPKSTLSTMITTGLYELLADKVQDVPVLLKIARDLEAKEKAAILPIVFRTGFTKHYGIVTGVIEGDKFLLLMSIASKQAQPLEAMPVNVEEIATTVSRRRNLPTLEDIGR